VPPVAPEPWSEHEAPPVRVLVHDPSETGALDTLRSVPRKQLQDRFLFRAIPDADAFAREHRGLVDALVHEGVEVLRLRDLVDDAGGASLAENPNHVYTRDPAIVLPWLPGRFLRGRMRKPIRRREPEILSAALERLRLEELPIRGTGALEGGDVIPVTPDARRTLVVGFGPRTARASLTDLCEALMPHALDAVVGIELVPERMNLDGAFVPVAADAALVEPSSIVRALLLDEAGERPVDPLRWLRENGVEPIVVTREEATAAQACNVVCVGTRRLVAYDLSARVVAELRRREFTVTTVAGTELIKGTGGPRCMTRPLYS
jgi:N-dimethylarginine dimethylaminohydrolase